MGHAVVTAAIKLSWLSVEQLFSNKDLQLTVKFQVEPACALTLDTTRLPEDATGTYVSMALWSVRYV